MNPGGGELRAPSSAEADRILGEVDVGELPAALGVGFLANAAYLHAVRGEIEQAEATLATLGPMQATIDDPRVPASNLLLVTFVHAFAGRLTEAYEAGMAGAVMPFEPGLDCAEWATHTALWLGDAPRARAALALFAARPERGRVVTARRQILQAGVQALEGDRSAAITGYRDAIRSWRDMDVPFFLGLTLLEFATLVGPGEPEARAAADEARAIFTRLGSPPLLTRLDAGLDRWRPAGAEAGATATNGWEAASTAPIAEPEGRRA